MKVLVVGGGAREHAIAAAAARGGADVYVTLKNRNPGLLRLAKAHALVNETDGAAVAEHAKAWSVDVAVLGMDAAIEAGVGDALEEAGIAVASPTKAAGEIEWNKEFMRNLLDKHAVPGRIRHRVFRSEEGLRDFIAELGAVAVKPLGLTGGKGVKVSGDHLPDVDAAFAYAKEILDTQYAGEGVLVEEKVEGEEFSLQGFCDGTTFAPMPAVQDHKRAFENDEGPNTGGMGAYSAAGNLLPFMTQADFDAGVEAAQAVVTALKEEGRPFRGALYAQFMLTKEGPRFVEVNARFGDPEAMNVLEILDTPYTDVLRWIVDGTLSENPVRFKPLATVCKYVVPEGYGTKPMANEPLEVDEAAIERAGATAYYASVNEADDGTLRTSTSRAIGVVAAAESIEEANARVEKALPSVKGPHLFMRHDIGTAELVQKRVAHMKALRE